ncbi:hypothetical protein EW146_g4066 [Bondarzewia mesenterica]|uniref:Amidase domain-containing protein n=1 Tax=Bondarzewia mesenterica TaxID=1095465 RepID=A0A4S4LW82_9AGAM|nr:hypothetical protein EW146_g4066 [Bondarzewia mesenterica]
MLPNFQFMTPWRDGASVRRRRQQKLNALAAVYDTALTEIDTKVHGLSLAQLVDAHRSGHVSNADVMSAYGKKAFAAQKATNCLSDIILPSILPHTARQANGNGIPKRGTNAVAGRFEKEQTDRPLAGVPISIKDCIDVAGHPSTLGYSAFSRDSVAASAPIIRLLQRAGAIVHVKTTVPAGLFGLETSSTLFGRTSNPYNSAFSPGASTGGGAALLALGGSMIELGTDIGGSVRLPAAFCGVYSMKASNGRFPATGARTSTPGSEGVQTVVSPLARRLEDLEEFWKRVMDLKPWEYDHTCVPMPWRPVNYATRKLKWGVLWSDGIIPMSPASRRAVQIVIDALRAQGHEVVDFEPPTFEVLKTGFQLTFADGGEQVFANLQCGEFISPGVRAIRKTFSLPRFFKHILAFFLPVLDATLLRAFYRKSVVEVRELVDAREVWKRVWHDKWRAEGIDFVICAPCAIPGVPEGGTSKAGLLAASYAFLFNIVSIRILYSLLSLRGALTLHIASLLLLMQLDLPAGVLPITTVSRKLDALPPTFRPSDLGPSARGAYEIYDAEKMHGLPVAVQVVGKRLEEEKVLAGMRVIRDVVVLVMTIAR